jgi:hypothetical protein
MVLVHRFLGLLAPVERSCLQFLRLAFDVVLFGLVTRYFGFISVNIDTGKVIASSARFCLFDLAW